SFVQRYPIANLACRCAFWACLYIGAVAAIGLMIANMFVFFEVQHFLDKKKLLMAGNIFSMEKSTRDAVTLPRTLFLAFLPIGLIAVQLFVVHAFPRFWRTTASFICRPVILLGCFIGFVGLTFWAQTPGHAFAQPGYGSFMHNPHVYLAASYLPERCRVLL